MFNPYEVTAIQEEKLTEDIGSISSSDIRTRFHGSIVVLRCGRKIAIDGIFPDELYNRINDYINLMNKQGERKA